MARPSPVLARPRRHDQSAARCELRPQLYRSVYLPIIRDQIPEFLSIFDFPDASLVNGDRDTTNVPSQSLFLITTLQAGRPMPLPNASASWMAHQRKTLPGLTSSPLAASPRKAADAPYASLDALPQEAGKTKPSPKKRQKASPSPPSARPCSRRGVSLLELISGTFTGTTLDYRCCRRSLMLLPTRPAKLWTSSAGMSKLTFSLPRWPSVRCV